MTGILRKGIPTEIFCKERGKLLRDNPEEYSVMLLSAVVVVLFPLIELC